MDSVFKEPTERGAILPQEDPHLNRYTDQRPPALLQLARLLVQPARLLLQPARMLLQPAQMLLQLAHMLLHET
jgi:hypothetical protein